MAGRGGGRGQVIATAADGSLRRRMKFFFGISGSDWSKGAGSRRIGEPPVDVRGVLVFLSGRLLSRQSAGAAPTARRRNEVLYGGTRA